MYYPVLFYTKESIMRGICDFWVLRNCNFVVAVKPLKFHTSHFIKFLTLESMLTYFAYLKPSTFT